MITLFKPCCLLLSPLSFVIQQNKWAKFCHCYCLIVGIFIFWFSDSSRFYVIFTVYLFYGFSITNTMEWTRSATMISKVKNELIKLYTICIYINILVLWKSILYIHLSPYRIHPNVNLRQNLEKFIASTF